MAQPTKDEILKDLIDFFQDELKRDRAGTMDWIASGDWDTDDFVAAIDKLKRELSLRDSAETSG